MCIEFSLMIAKIIQNNDVLLRSIIPKSNETFDVDGILYSVNRWVIGNSGHYGIAVKAVQGEAPEYVFSSSDKQFSKIEFNSRTLSVLERMNCNLETASYLANLALTILKQDFNVFYRGYKIYPDSCITNVSGLHLSFRDKFGTMRISSINGCIITKVQK